MIFLKLFQSLGNDFVVYYEAAKMFLAGANPYLGLITRTFPFNYPPASLLFLFPLGFFDFNTANVIWNILSTLSVIISIRLLTKKHFLPLVLLFTVFFFPVKFNIGNAQINHFLLLFVTLSIYFYNSGRKNFSAFFLAFAICIKLAPIIFLLYFFIIKDYRQIARIFAFVVFIVLITFIFVPASYQWTYLHDVLPLSFTSGAKDWYYNQSLWGFLARQVGSLAPVLYYPLAILILVVTWWRGKKINSVRALAAVSCLYLLIHPIALQHYFGFAIIPFILLLNRRDWKILTIAYLLLAFDIKNFSSVSKEYNFILSHDFYGVLILWLLALWPKNIWKIMNAIWVCVILTVYVFALICRGRSC